MLQAGASQYPGQPSIDLTPARDPPGPLLLHQIIPDEWPGGVDFNPACNGHDRCYSIPGEAVALCSKRIRLLPLPEPPLLQLRRSCLPVSVVQAADKHPHASVMYFPSAFAGTIKHSLSRPFSARSQQERVRPGLPPGYAGRVCTLGRVRECGPAAQYHLPAAARHPQRPNTHQGWLPPPPPLHPRAGIPLLNGRCPSRAPKSQTATSRRCRTSTRRWVGDTGLHSDA